MRQPPPKVVQPTQLITPLHGEAHPKGALTTAIHYNGGNIYSTTHGRFRVIRDALKGSTERKVHWTFPKKPDVAAWKKSLRLIGEYNM